MMHMHMFMYTLCHAYVQIQRCKLVSLARDWGASLCSREIPASHAHAERLPGGEGGGAKALICM